MSRHELEGGGPGVAITGIGRSSLLHHPITEFERQKGSVEEEYHLVSIADVGVCELAGSAALDLVKRHRIRPDKIEAVVFCTESIWEDQFPRTESERRPAHLRLRDELLATLFDGVGISNAAIYGNWLSACGNFTTSLTLARSLVLSGQHRNVLVLLADRLRPGATRVQPSRAVGDAATALFLSRGHGFEITSILSRVEASLIRLRRSQDTHIQALGLGRSLKSLAAFLRVEHPDLDNFDYLVVENVCDAIKRSIGSAIGVTPARLLSPSRRTYGHAFSSDLALSLMTMESENLRRGSRVLLLNIGAISTGVIELTYHPNATVSPASSAS